MRFVQVQVSDEAAGRIADDLQRLDLHAEACCIQVLLRDRATAEAALRRIAHFPWNVNTSAEADLRDVKKLAEEALHG